MNPAKNNLSIEQLSMKYRMNIRVFFAVHYILLVYSIGVIIFKRCKEIDSVVEINQKTEYRAYYYYVNGIAYARYNVEILNFFVFSLLINFLYKRQKILLIIKLFFEGLLISLIILK